MSVKNKTSWPKALRPPNPISSAFLRTSRSAPNNPLFPGQSWSILEDEKEIFSHFNSGSGNFRVAHWLFSPHRRRRTPGARSQTNRGNRHRASAPASSRTACSPSKPRLRLGPWLLVLARTLGLGAGQLDDATAWQSEVGARPLVQAWT